MTRPHLIWLVLFITLSPTMALIGSLISVFVNIFSNFAVSQKIVLELLTFFTSCVKNVVVH